LKKKKEKVSPIVQLDNRTQACICPMTGSLLPPYRLSNVGTITYYRKVSFAYHHDRVDFYILKQHNYIRIDESLFLVFIHAAAVIVIQNNNKQQS